jgi:16S rRNA (guanine(966)-N(2))-methyltransferase RsmD
VRVPKGIRPTEGKVREALFSIWHDRVGGKRFLDLFAGSGAVGLEALSRGAREVVFVEKSSRVRKVLEGNCRALTDRGWLVVTATLPKDLVTLVPRGTFDLVFADPPYSFSSYSRLLFAVGSLLDPEGLFAVETSSRRAPPDAAGDLALLDSRRYGESRLTFYCSSRASTPG